MGWDSNCKVISICNPGRNTNSIRCLETVANLLNKKLPSKFLKSIKNILNPDKFNFQEILDRLRDHNITFTKTKQTFGDIFSGQTATGDMLLIVSSHGLNDHKDGNVGNPKKDVYVMCSIVIPQPPYLVLTFSSANRNCWLEKKCIQQDWGMENNKPKDFFAYMRDNMYQKMDPIKKMAGSPAKASVKRNAHLTRAYIIDNFADAYLPNKNPIQL